MKVVHSWLKEYVGDSLPEVHTVEDLLNFHAFEVDGVELDTAKEALRLGAQKLPVRCKLVTRPDLAEK